MLLSLIVHERLGRWVRQVRPRLAGRPVRVIETRSLSDLQTAARRSACPMVVIVAGDRVGESLEAIDAVVEVAPNGLVLVIGPADFADFPRFARELGASLVISSATPPPTVVSLLERWIPIAQARCDTEGWAEDRVPEPEPWEIFLGPPAPASDPL